MTVSELIEALRAMPQDLPAVTNGGDCDPPSEVIIAYLDGRVMTS